MGGVFRPSPPPPPPPPAPKPAPAPQPVATPTQAEVSQSAATDQEGYKTQAKVRRRGRSATILTTPTGVQEETATLGRRSLLGQ